MATGAGFTDPHGVWMVGESDTVNALFSDFLNRIGVSVSAIISARVPFVAASGAARDSYFGVPATAAARVALQNRGARCTRTDKGYIEQYFAGKNDPTTSANPGGKLAPGWYCVTTIHAEYTFSVSIPNGTPTAIQSFVLDVAASSSTAAEFFAPSAGQLTNIQAGRVMMNGVYSLGAGTTGRTFSDLGMAGDGGRLAIPVGEDGGVTVTGSRSVPVSGALTMTVYQITGATRTVAGRVTVDYLGPL